MGENIRCVDCDTKITEANRSKDTVDEYPICNECSDKRWRDFMAA